MQNCKEAYENAKMHLAAKYGLPMQYTKHSHDFETEFGAQVIRNIFMEEIMVWPTEEEYTLWLLKWS